MEEGNKYKMAARIKPGVGLRPGDGRLEPLTRAPRVANRRRPRRRRRPGGERDPDRCRPQPRSAAARRSPAGPRPGAAPERPELGPAPSSLRPPGPARGGHGRLQVGRGREGTGGGSGPLCGLAGGGGGEWGALPRFPAGPGSPPRPRCGSSASPGPGVAAGSRVWVPLPGPARRGAPFLPSPSLSPLGLRTGRLGRPLERAALVLLASSS